MNNKSTIVIAFFSNPEHVAPVYDAICLLAKQFNVIVVHRNSESLDYEYPTNVVVYKVGKEIKLDKYNKTKLELFFEFYEFIFKIRVNLRKYRASLLFCYDLNAFVAGSIASRFLGRLPIFYHQNETVLLKEISISRPFYWLKYLEMFFAKKVNVLSFPEPNRARLFLEDADIEKDVIIVENCPMKLIELPKCSSQVKKLKSNGCKIVFYRGPIGDGSSIDIHETIRSIKFWPPNAVLVIVGFRTSKEEELCRDIMREENVEDRVIFAPFVRTIEELLQYTVAADVGLVLYKPLEINRKYVAPCKLYDYCSCGVPVIVPSALPYLSKMVSDLGVGLSYLESTPESIGMTISKLLNHPDKKIMGEKARKEHLSRLNFETQFKPLMDEITKYGINNT